MLRRILLPLLALVSCISSLTPVVYADANDAYFQATPASTSLHVGDTFTVSLYVSSTATAYTRANFAYSFTDKSETGLQYVSANTTGSDFDTPGSAGFNPAVSPGAPASLQCLHIDRSSSQPLTGKHLLGSFTFKTIEAGSYTLSEDTASCASTIYGADGTTDVRAANSATNSVDITVTDATSSGNSTQATSGTSTSTTSNTTPNTTSPTNPSSQPSKPQHRAAGLPIAATSKNPQPQLPLSPLNLSKPFKTVAVTTMGTIAVLILIAFWISRHILAYPLFKRVTKSISRRIASS